MRKQLLPSGTDARVYLVSLILLVPCVAFELAVVLSPTLHVSILWRALLFFAVCLSLWLCARRILCRTADGRLMRCTLYLILAVYVYLLLCATLLEKGFGRSELISSAEDARAYYLRYFVNLRPFRSIWEVYILGFVNGYVAPYYMHLNLLGNLCALVPLAFLLPRLFSAQRRWYVFLLTSILTVIAVELLQFLLMVGSCDIDDLLLNVFGAMLGYIALRPAKKASEREEQ